ncbi:MAG: radical SAM protein [Spirochaetales bacterium]|nr:radical SAM protein [Spirochaetales bacterium]
MSKCIAIVAPMRMEKQYEADFRLLLENSGQELNLPFLYEFISYDYTAKNKVNQYKEDTIPAAGYFLSTNLRRAGYDTVLTQRIDDFTMQSIARENPIAVCISTTMILRKKTCLEVIIQIKKNMPDVIIIIGGMLVLKSFLVYRKEEKDEDEESWQLFDRFEPEYENCLFIISHHGISSLYRVLKEIEKGKNADYLDIPNLAVPLNNSLYFTQYKEDIIDINNEYTHWELLEKIPYRIPIRASIGCPYRCVYCDFNKLYPGFLTRNMDSIKKELSTIKKIVNSQSQPALLHFTDDNIFIKGERLQAICRTIIDSEIQLPWLCFMRASGVNKSDIHLLKESNLLMSMIGVESGDQGLLQAMKKEQDLRQIKSVIELLDENRISVLMTFIVGFPGENKETLNNTLMFVNSLNLKNIFLTYHLYPLKIISLSPVLNTENRQKWNVQGFYNKWKHYTMDSLQANEETYYLFKNIDDIPYHYLEESNFFNYRFSYEQRKKLFNLRKDLTIAVFEKVKTEKIQTIFKDIALAMRLPVKLPGNEIIKQLTVPGY